LLYKLRQYIKQSVILIAIIICASLTHVSAEEQMIGVDELKTGMRGFAKTVVQGTTIETFDVEVLSIMKNQGPAGDLILVRVSGDVIDRTEGIASGMSGSPVYIDGKLAGAVAYGWPMTDRRICMVTPIQGMLKLWETPNEQKPQSVQQVDLEPVTTPLMVSGLGPRALDKLAEYLEPFGLTPMASGSYNSTNKANHELEPGSAIGVQLMRGDLDMTAIGTLTYRDGDKIIGFGHPFLRRGNTNYLMTSAYIHQTVPGLDNSFKLGTSMDLVGTVDQDRGAGIGGKIGVYPHTIPLRIHVTDKDTGREKELFVQAVQDEQLSPALLTTAAMQAIEQTLDRTGLGTSWVKINILGKDLPGDNLIRENMYFHPTDVGAGSVGELLEGLALVLNNPFTPVEIIDIKLDIEIEKVIKVANIETAKVMKPSAKPGETIPIDVTLRPYRGTTITETINFTVPKDQAPGSIAVGIRGGGSMPQLQKLLAQFGGQELQTQKPENLEQFLKDFIQRDRNNEIIAEIMPLGLAGDPAAMLGGELAVTGNTKSGAVPKNNPVSAALLSDPTKQVKMATNYIIDGSSEVVIQVLSPLTDEPRKKK